MADGELDRRANNYAVRQAKELLKELKHFTLATSVLAPRRWRADARRGESYTYAHVEVAICADNFA